MGRPDEDFRDELPVEPTRVLLERGSPELRLLGGDAAGGCVRRIIYANKRNDINPHRAWALKSMSRADVSGVADPGVTFVDLLEARIHPAGEPPVGPGADEHTVLGSLDGRAHEVPA